MLCVLLSVSLRRLIDGDEGYLLMAARLVSEGHLPYADFFCPQMPGMPLLFGFLFKIGPRNWSLARDFSAVICALTGLCVFELSLRATRSLRWSLLAVVLFTGHSFTLGWLTIAKTYGLTSLFVLAGCLMFALPRSRTSVFAAALCFALAAEVRLYAGALIPLAFVALLFAMRADKQPASAQLRMCGFYALGVGVGVVLLLPILWSSSEAFWFGTVSFHSMRETGQSELVGQLGQKWQVLTNLFPLRRTNTAAQWQFAAIFFPALVSRIFGLGTGFRIVGVAWVALFAVSFLPTPTHDQYFSVLVPLLVVDSVVAMSSVPWRFTWIPALTLSLFFARWGAEDLHRYTVSGLDVPGVWTTDRVARWRIQTMAKVARAIDSEKLDEGASWWPGYFVSTRTQMTRTLANDFGFRVANRVSLAKKAKYHLASQEDVAAMIHSHLPRLFVQGNWAAVPPADQLSAAGYVEVSQVENVRIWVAPKHQTEIAPPTDQFNR